MKRSSIISLIVVAVLLLLTVVPTYATSSDSNDTSSDTSSRKVTLKDVAAGAATIYDLYGPDYKLHIPDAAETYNYTYHGEWNGYIENGELYLTEHSSEYDQVVVTVPAFIEVQQENSQSTIQIPVKHIGNEAFGASHKKLKSIIISEGIESVGKLVSNNMNLLALYLPSTLKTIKDGAFNDCRGIEELHIADIEMWCSLFFDYPLSNPLAHSAELYVNGKIFSEIPEGVTEIKQYCFFWYNGLKELKLPSSLKSIGDSAFARCMNLEYVEFNEGLETIGNGAFQTCAGLSEIVLGKNVQSVGENAFSECENLSKVYFKGNETKINQFAFGHQQSQLPKVTVYGHIGSTAEKYATSCNLNFVDITTVKLETEKSRPNEPTTLPQNTTNTIGALNNGSTDSKEGFPWIYVVVAGGVVIITVIVAVVVITSKRKKQT